MKRIILLGLLIISLSVNAQDFYSSGDCKAAFKFEVNPNIYTLVPATAINFYDTSEGEVKHWYWDFGDGNTSKEQNPMFIFNHPLGGPNVKINPYRTVRLTIVTDSCKSTVSQVINIMEGSLYEQPSCLARFKYYEMSRDSLAGTVTFHFDDRSEGKDLTYFWQFTNEITSTEQNPEITLPLGQPEYKVCLTVTGADSCVSTVCEPVYVEYPVFIDTIIYPACYADFGFERKDLLMSPLPSVVIDFYSKSFPEATEWFWDFGDGTTSNEPKPTHVYTMPAISDSINVMYNPFRTVCLTVKTAEECKVSICQTIQVFGWVPEPEPEKCPVYFKYYRPDDIMSIPEVVPIQLVDVTEGEIISRLWQFEDGSTSTEKELLVTFDIFQPVHKVCLTVNFADSCTNTFCEAVYVSNGYTDTVVVVDPIIINPDCPYYIKIDGGFPPEMSSCAGWASAKVYLKDEEVIPQIISWSTGDTLAKVNGLCPTRTYTVKALMPDGCAIWTNFVLGSDGSITPVSPINWWLSGEREKMYVRSDVAAGMKVEWRLCDGTMVEADSIPLDEINCGGNVSNMIVKDSLGNVVYSENISLKGSVTGIEDIQIEPTIKLWPNPVTSKLNIRYSGEYQSKITVEISDIMGKLVSAESYSNIYDGQEFSINTELLKQGIYICRISSAGKTIKTHKFSRK
jgi:PKD repeat protein